MYKCKSCGTEFDGKFCPECGTPASPDVCPECGAPLPPAVKFCPECGKKLTAESHNSMGDSHEEKPIAHDDLPKREKKQGASPALVAVCSLLPYATAALFALFSVLLFLMLLGSVSTIFGMGTGSVYQNLSLAVSSEDGLGEMGAAGGNAIANVCAALVAFAVLGAVLAACALAFRLYVPLRVKKIGDLRICTLLDWGILLFYFIDFLLGCILCGTVSDEITSPGAAPVCVLVFALLFGLCSAGIVVLRKFLPKFLPAVVAEQERKEAERRATLTPPAEPARKVLEKPEPPEKPMYRAEECPADLAAKIVKHVKAKKLFMIFSGLTFALCAFTCTYIWLLFANESSFFHYERALPENFLGVGVGIICSYAVLTIVLGGIFGSIYYKKPVSGSVWRYKSSWSDKEMLWTASAFCLVLTAICAMFSLMWDPIYQDGSKEPFIQIVMLVCVFPFAVVYCSVVFPIAGVLVRKGKKLSLAVFGIQHPWLNSELEEQYLADANAYVSRKQTYIEQKNAYLAERNEQRKVWRKYRRELAYYEEGIAPPQSTAQNTNI